MTMPDPGWMQWMPIGIRARPPGWAATWCFFEGIRPTDPFFQQTLNHALGDPARMLFLRETPVGFLADLARDHPGIAPSGFIFHLSRCGSTLVSRMLASLARNLVISEAPVIDQAIQLAERGALGAPPGSTAVLRGLVSAIAQPRNGEDRLFIKFDSWHVRQLPAILDAFPEVPWIFLYRDPVEILVSQGRMLGSQMVPGIVDPRRLGIDPGSVDPAALGEYSARVLAQLCRAAIANRGLGRGLFVNYSELPGAVHGPISRHFGADPSPAESSAMADCARFDAKAPGMAFEADSAAKQREAGEGTRILARQWLAAPYGELEAIRRGQARG